MEEIGRSQMTLTSHSETELSGTITVSEGDTQILTTIPFDKGWIITVDGEEIQYEKALDALITFELEEGEHTIEMKYLPDSFVRGSLISVLGICAFVLWESGEYISRKKRRNI